MLIRKADDPDETEAKDEAVADGYCRALGHSALLAAGTSHSGPATLHGRASPLGPAPTAALPAGEGTAVHVTATCSATSPSDDLLSGEDRQIGPAYDFTVAKEPSSALISFTVDPAKLAASIGVAGASPAGLYIQIYEPALGFWIPLKSICDRNKHAITAARLVTRGVPVACIGPGLRTRTVPYRWPPRPQQPTTARPTGPATGKANTPFGTLRVLSGEAHCGLLPRIQTAEGCSRPDRDAINEDGHDRADHDQIRQGD